MADVVNNVVTNFLVNNKGAAALSQLTKSGDFISKKFNEASNIVGAFGSIAAIAGGALSLTHIVKGTQEYLERLKKVQDYTHMSAENAGGLVDAMEGVGIGGEEATRALMMMSRAGARAEMSGRGMRQGVAGMSKEYKRLGIDMKHPEQAMFRMATLVKEHRIDQAKVGLLMHVQGDTARKLTNMLALGPEHIREQMKEYAKLGIATQKNINMQERIRMLNLKVRSTWENIQRIIGITFLPLIEKGLNGVSNILDEWLPKAQAFGEGLSKFLEKHYRIILATGKVLMANFILMRLTGGTGIVGTARKGYGMAGKLAGLLFGGAVSAGGTAAAGAGTAAAGAGTAAAGVALAPVLAVIAAIAAIMALIYVGWKAIKNNTDGIRTRLLELWAKIQIHAYRIYEAIRPILVPLGKLFGKTGPVGHFFAMLMPRVIQLMLKHIEVFLHAIRAGIIVVGELWDMFLNLWPDIQTAALSAWDSIILAFQDWVVGPIMVMWQDITEAYDTYLAQPISEAWAAIYNFFVTYFVNPVKEALAAVFKWLSPYIEALTGMKFDLGAVQPLADMVVKAWKKTEVSALEVSKVLRHQQDRQAETTADRPPAPNYDFRNSRFDITQKFAEGFDPDRIALAFSSDLAALGERKLQSGFSPLYSVR